MVNVAPNARYSTAVAISSDNPKRRIGLRLRNSCFEDKLELIATGHCVAVLPAGDHRATNRDDIAVVPLAGIEPCEVVLVTRAHAC
ncbi:hypothetical protein K7711_23265 [Nocardia sp. CA2R105]|uniref:hypothetical protein n=1 Tax=Nocardia coffeae TaxID=2873381 RepID=UPI001CA71126|nr:hypothetical protein [Nocardia coffeae]MBY8859406.1 hypothetical protein [Nocardia coffeae]